MEDYELTHEMIQGEMEELLSKCEKMDWNYKVYGRGDQEKNNGYVELCKFSPAGEDFGMIIDFMLNDQKNTFLKDLQNYCEDFDPERHAVMWYGSQKGESDSLLELINDAKSIKEDIQKLYNNLIGVE